MKACVRLVLYCAAAALFAASAIAEPKTAEAKDPAALKAAARLWTKHCTSCHGARGRGDGPDAKTLEKATPDFTDSHYMSMRSDSDLFRKLTIGRRPMPA